MTSVTSAEMASELLSATSRADLRERVAELCRQYSAQELTETAEQLKDEEFERDLDDPPADDPRAARRLALGLTALGRGCGLLYIEALGMLARADVERKDLRLKVAMAHFKEAEELFLAANSPVGRARARTGWVLARSDHGSLDLADLLRMDEFWDVMEESAKREHLANAHQNVAVAYATLSHFPEAATHWAAALASLKEVDSPRARKLAGQILGNLAFVELWQGNFETAFTRHIELRVLFEELQSYRDIVLVDLKLSLIEQERGHLAEALDFAASGYEKAMARGLDNAAAIARLTRAKVLLKLNRVAEAATAGAEALAVLSSQHDASELVDAYCTCAEALERQGDHAGALKQLEQAATVAESYSHPNTYRINLERAALLLRPQKGEVATSRMQRAATARDLAREVADRGQANDVLMHRHMALLLQAESEQALGSNDEARTLAESLLAEGIQSIGPEIAFRCQLLLARIARHVQGPVAALAHYDAMVDILGGFIEELAYDRRTDYLVDKDALYLEALTVALDAREPARALAYLEEQRARSVWLTTSGGDSELERLRREHRGISASLASGAMDPEDAAEGRGRLRELDSAIAERLAARATRVASQMEVDISAVLRAIPAGSVIAAYALTNDELVTFVLLPGRIESAREPIASAQLDLPMIHLQARIDGFVPSPIEGNSADALVSDMQVDLQALWSILLQPVAPLLPGDGGTLLFVPHQQLHAVPFAALWDGTRYCVERWTVQTLSSCHALLQPPALATGASALSGHAPLGREGVRSLLALGYADDEQNLPNVTREAERVAAATGGTAAVGPDATLGLLRRESDGSSYLHLAAHGAVRLDIPNSSYIELADGLFHPLDALTLPLHQCQLVVLSACETGLGKTFGGDEQVGLVRAFGLAGADVVVATLWRVNDTASMVLMELLYERLAAGASPASALSAAQRAFTTGAAGGALRNPYYWAGYQLAVFRPAPATPLQ